MVFLKIQNVRIMMVFTTPVTQYYVININFVICADIYILSSFAWLVTHDIFAISIIILNSVHDNKLKHCSTNYY